METNFLKLGFNKKEYVVYMYLVEYWISSASEISRYIKIPKSTVNFLADNLWKRWMLRKSFRWKTGYFEVDVKDLEKNILDEIHQKENVLKLICPVLLEKNKNTFSRPKIEFIDWLDNCKKAYLELLNIKWKFYEFWDHSDLENAFWKVFMDNFIEIRVKKGIFCDALWNDSKIENELHLRDKKELRNLKIFSNDYGKMSSSIAFYENKVLILNLNKSFSWVLIENEEFFDTMRTIFNICKKS